VSIVGIHTIPRCTFCRPAPTCGQTLPRIPPAALLPSSAAAPHPAAALRRSPSILTHLPSSWNPHPRGSRAPSVPARGSPTTSMAPRLRGSEATINALLPHDVDGARVEGVGRRCVAAINALLPICSAILAQIHAAGLEKEVERMRLWLLQGQQHRWRLVLSPTSPISRIAFVHHFPFTLSVHRAPAALRSSLGRETSRQRLDVLFPSSHPHTIARSSLHLSLHGGCRAGVKEARLLQLLEAGDRLLKGVVLDGLLRQRGRVVLSHGLGRGRKQSLVRSPRRRGGSRRGEGSPCASRVKEADQGAVRVTSERGGGHDGCGSCPVRLCRCLWLFG
jgi:hypothetical protein